MTIVKSADITSVALPPAGQRPGADRGDPQLGVQRLAENASGNVGIWECQPGGWPVNNRPDTEVAIILSGSPTLTDASTGDATSVAAGDLVTLPPGWTGRWNVTETVRKIYAIY
jgi:uncharacterized cupin superfamily protein